MPSTKRIPHHSTATTIVLWSIAILLNAVVVDRVCATDLDASTWREVSIDPGPSDPADGGWAIGDGGRARLPGNNHVVIGPRSLTRTPASAVTMPTCGAIGDGSGDGIGVVAWPGLAQMTGDAPATYAKALHDCLMRGANMRAWIVDLRRNTGGNMYPMIGGLAPLLPVGKLYAFANGHGVATAQVGLDRGGVTINHKPAFSARDVGSRVGPPVVVVFGATCGSSCEQTANALAVRPRTLFIGEPTAGYLTANTPLLINDAYVMLLTTGYTQDPCGRVLEDNLTPDVAVDHVGTRSIEELLALPLVSDWLVRQRTRPSGTSQATPRCDPPPHSASR